MVAKLDFLEQGRDPDAEREEFEQLVQKYEASCKKEGDEVRAIGGLHIIGTERHESRRIDNQLRGRAGRQGDPGSSRFYLSLEDDLMRIFAGDKVKGLMERMGMPDDEPIEHPWVSKSILDAQSKVEGRNFDIRKNLLEYDDVMNEQRKTVYKIRQQLLLGVYYPEILGDDGKPSGKMREIQTLDRIAEEIKDAVAEMILFYAAQGLEEGARPKKLEDIKHISDDQLEALRASVYEYWGYRFDYDKGDGEEPADVVERLVEELPYSLTMQRERLLDLVDGIIGAVVEESCPANKPPEDWDWKGMRAAFIEHFGSKPEEFDHIHDLDDLAHNLYSQAYALLEAKEKEVGTELFLRVFRHFYLEEIDRQWVDHLTAMEHLRDGIGLRGYGQRDPKQEYKKEGFEIFVTMMATTSSNVITKIMKVKVQQESEIARIEREDYERHARQAQAMQLRHGGEVEGGDEPPPPPPRRQISAPPARKGPSISRNDLCPCGSGEKFKSCHGAALEEEDDAQA